MESLKKYWIYVAITFTLFMLYKPVICFLILGFLATSIGGYYFNFLFNIKKKGVKVIGKITSYQSDYEGYKFPTIEFITLEGRQIKQRPHYYAATDLSKIKDYNKSINKSASVIYNPNNPKKFILDNESVFNYVSLIFFIIIGLIFFIVGISSLLGYIEIDF